jgi:DNA modification methylase
LRSKDLIPIAWLVGLALQRDGWWLRADNIWEKPSVMPFSGTDRTTISHEYLLLLSKRERYFYDAFAIREPAVYGDHPRNGTPDLADIQAPGQARQSGLTKLRREGGYVPSEWRNRRSVWTIPTQGFDEAHFASYPPALVEPCILAGTSERGCCATCGSPWKRLLERRGTISARGGERKHLQTMARAGATSAFATGEYASWETAGWKATCACGGEPVPCRVLDPFSGAGTTVMVARRLGRAAEGIELSGEYVKMSQRRILGDAPLLNRRGDAP